MNAQNYTQKSLEAIQAAQKLTIENQNQQIEQIHLLAALLRQDGKFLICQRPAHKARGLLWEFVGGKVEPGETKREALARECREELGVAVSVGDVYMELTHVYPDLTIHLTLFHAEITDGVPQLLEHCAMDWITPEEIGGYDFCPADEEILARLRLAGKTAAE